eukprot:3817739-Rhodomonas_salina.1
MLAGALSCEGVCLHVTVPRVTAAVHLVFSSTGTNVESLSELATPSPLAPQFNRISGMTKS